MSDVLMRLHRLTRPQILIKTARIGSKNYKRSNYLPKIFGLGVPLKSDAILQRLLELETEQNDLRLAMDASYSVMQHINLMIAIVGEARNLRAS